MPKGLPDHFTRLGPFRDLFATGFPVLTYHKFGPRPRRARLGGLYLGAPLFAAQVRSLARAGFAFASPGEFTTRPAGTAVALTIDDGFESVREHALPILVSLGARATLYLVADRLGGTNDWEIAQGEVAAGLMDDSGVREWLAAGQWIGAHSLTHPWLTRLNPGLAREEIAASRKRLEDRFGVPVTDFCYPYGDWNPGVRDLVREAGYRTATTTDFGVNLASTPPLELRRITARHASRSVRAVKGWLRRWVTGLSGAGGGGPQGGDEGGSSPSVSQRG